MFESIKEKTKEFFGISPRQNSEYREKTGLLSQRTDSQSRSSIGASPYGIFGPANQRLKPIKKKVIVDSFNKKKLPLSQSLDDKKATLQ